MRRLPLVPLALLALAPAALALVGPGVYVEEVVACFPDAVVTNPGLNHTHFLGYACGTGVNFVQAAKVLTGSTLEWTITTPHGQQHCVFTDVARCDPGPGDVPVVANDPVAFDVQLYDGGPVGNVVFIGAQLEPLAS
jgi:hypothetical protein